MRPKLTKALILTSRGFSFARSLWLTMPYLPAPSPIPDPIQQDDDQAIAREYAREHGFKEGPAEGDNR